jgi:glycosyltransferase involved in cell wall biosynthesis
MSEPTERSATHRYLIVVPVAFVPVADGRAAIESAFAEHLKLLLDSLAPAVQQIEVIAPLLPAASDTTGMCVLDPRDDRIRFVAAYPNSIGRVAYWLALPRLMARVWQAVGRARFVHAGPSTFYRPLENFALLFGWLRRRTTIYVTDIDQRQSPRMCYQTEQWSFGVYVRARFLHQKWENLQHHIARWICSMMLLKGRALVRDFGRGKSKVHYILDSAYSREMILATERQAARWIRIDDASRPMRACYFGRLVTYKGIDRMLQAIAAAREAGADVTLDLYGGGDQEAELRSLAGSLGLQDAVRFHGVRTYGLEFFRELDDYDVLLAAPLSEDTPRSALDAQALGMPILAFDTYYYRELAEFGAGVCVVAWPDVAALAEQMVRLFRDRSALVALGQRGIVFAAQNTQESWLERRAVWTLAVARS